MDDDQVFDIGIDPDDSVEPAEARLRQDRSDRRRGLAIAALLVALCGGLILLNALADGDSPQARREAQPTPVEASTDEIASSPRATAGDSGGDGDGVSTTATTVRSGIPPSASHMRHDRVANAFAEVLDSGATRYGLAYIAEDGLTVLDASGITVPEVDIAQRFGQVDGLAMLTADGRTWAVDTDDRDKAYLVSNVHVVVESGRANTLAVIDTDRMEAINLISSGLPVPSVELPRGADLIWVQRRGMFVLPRTGGTFELAGTAASLVQVSDDRAVAASLGAVVYERCNEQLECTFRVQVGGVDRAVELPFAQRADLSVSPDGSWVVGVDSGAAALVHTETGQSHALDPGVVDAMAWTPDSRFVAMLRGDVIQIVEPETLDAVELGLNTPARIDELLMFASDAPVR